MSVAYSVTSEIKSYYCFLEYIKMVEILRIGIKVLSFLSVAMMAIGFVFPEWYKISEDGKYD